MNFEKLKKAKDFIKDEEIKKTIDFAVKNKKNIVLIEEILKKANKIKGLNHKEALVLLLCEIEEKNLEIFKLANIIKNKIYGKRIVLFAPLYISNYCVNGCLYCPYCFNNKTTKRIKLTQKEIKDQTIALYSMGHKRIALEAGEDNSSAPMEYILQSIDTIYGAKNEKNVGLIRRINVNIAATTIENYTKLKQKNIGTYVLFQETYDRVLYEKFHPTGPKSDYEFHTTAMDRALKAGIKDIGLGVLFGLADYKYDFTALLMHKEHLEKMFKIGPHTISVPRINPANNVDFSIFENKISDETLLKIIACFRIAAPYVGIIMSTRENEKLREKSIKIGVSQISAGSSTSIGGYGKKEKTINSAQFETKDKRSLEEVVNWLLKLNQIPSFCTACYEKKRVGETFMELSKSCKIKNFCSLNAILTLKEYLENFAGNDTKIIGENTIKKEINSFKNEKLKYEIAKYCDIIEKENKTKNLF